MKTITNEPIDNTFNEIVLNSAVTLTADSGGDTWTLVLPPNDGTNGQVLTTDGAGITSWTSATSGTVTSVGLTAPSFLSVSNSPITGSGDLALSFGTALPVANGGTGVTTSTGSGNVVLSSSPSISGLTGTGTTNLDTLLLTTTLAVGEGGTGVTGTSTGSTGVVLKDGPTMSALTGTGITNFTGNTRVTGFTGDMMYIGNAIGDKTTSILRWTGTTNDLTNHFDIAFFGGGTGMFQFAASGNADFSGDLILAGDLSTEGVVISTGTNAVTLQSAVTTDVYSFILPPNGGTANYILTTNGSGTTSWREESGGGGGGGTVTSVGVSSPSFLTVSNSPVTSSGTIALTLSGSALPVTSGGTGVLLSTGTGTKFALNDTPEFSTPKIVGTSFNTTIDTEATEDYTFKLPVDGGTANQIFRSDGDGTNSWMGLATSMGVLGGDLSVSTSTLTDITDNAQGITDNANAIGNNLTAQNLVNVAQGITNFAQGVTNATQATTNAGFITSIGTNATNIGTNSASLLTRLSSVALIVPSFLSVSGSPITTTIGGGGVIAIALSGTPLSVLGGGTGVTTKTGVGNVVLSTGPFIDGPILTNAEIKGTVFNTIIKTAATLSNWDLTLPSDGGLNNQVLTTNGSGTTTWTSATGGTVTSVQVSVPAFMIVNSSPVTSSGTIAITLTGTALPIVNGGTGATSATGTGDLVLQTSPEITTPLFTSLKVKGLFNNTTIDTQATEDWTLSLPINGGTTGQLLTSNGGGTTTWTTPTTGSVESVGLTAPSFLTVSNSPITSSGDIALSFGTALPVANGGTGAINATGTGNVVLQTNATLGNLTGTGTTTLGTTNTGTMSATSFTCAGTNTLGPVTTGTLSAQATSMSSLSISTPLDTTSGGTGVSGTSTGSSGVVLKNTPTIAALTGTGITNFTGQTRVTGFTGDMMYIGNSLGTNESTILKWTGTGNDDQNHIDIGFPGNSTLYEFRADGQATIPKLATGQTSFTGPITMNSNEIFLKDDTAHGIKYNATIDGPEVFGFAKGQLSTASTGRMFWDNRGISTNDSNYFKYTESSWTPTWGGSGTPVYTERNGHFVKCGQQTTVVFQLVLTVSGATPNEDVFFTGLGLTNPLSFFQRCNLSFAEVPILQAQPMNLTIQNGSTDLKLHNGLNVQVQTDGAGDFVGKFYSVFSYISA